VRPLQPRPAAGSSPGQRGQGLTEFALILPIFLILLVAMLEFGMAFSDRLTMGNATREGARIGAAMGTGTTTTCSGDPNGVDTTIIASIQNILKSGGSDVELSNITQIRIYRASSTGAQIGSSVNVWTYTPGAGPDADPDAGTEILDFSPSSVSWAACSRSNTPPNPDSIGVRIDYRYRLNTPLAALLNIVGGSQAATIDMIDHTVMALNPY
jgi:hypothetical protein